MFIKIWVKDPKSEVKVISLRTSERQVGLHARFRSPHLCRKLVILRLPLLQTLRLVDTYRPAAELTSTDAADDKRRPPSSSSSSSCCSWRWWLGTCCWVCLLLTTTQYQSITSCVVCCVMLSSLLLIVKTFICYSLAKDLSMHWNNNYRSWIERFGRFAGERFIPVHSSTGFWISVGGRASAGIRRGRRPVFKVKVGGFTRLGLADTLMYPDPVRVKSSPARPTRHQIGFGCIPLSLLQLLPASFMKTFA